MNTRAEFKNALRSKKRPVELNQENGFKKNKPNPTMIPQYIAKKAQALITEALFIGIIKPECRNQYLKIAQTSVEAFESLRDILRVEKASLVNRYDTLLRHGKLFQLEASEYEKLYRAKYLIQSRGIPKQNFHSTQ